MFFIISSDFHKGKKIQIPVENKYTALQIKEIPLKNIYQGYIGRPISIFEEKGYPN